MKRKQENSKRNYGSIYASLIGERKVSEESSIRDNTIKKNSIRNNITKDKRNNSLTINRKRNSDKLNGFFPKKSYVTRASLIILAIIFVVAFFSGQVSAIPVPHGIDGSVFFDDGKTQIPAGEIVRITNQDTGKEYQAITGHGPFSGRYSTTLEGTDGDMLTVEITYENVRSSRNITLSGSMHDVDMIIDYPAGTHTSAGRIIESRTESSSDAKDYERIPDSEDVSSYPSYYKEHTYSNSVPPITVIAGTIDGLTDEKKAILTNTRTGEIVEEEISFLSERKGKFRIVITGKSKDSLLLTVGDSNPGFFEFGNDHADLELLKKGKEIITLRSAEQKKNQENHPEDEPGISITGKAVKRTGSGDKIARIFISYLLIAVFVTMIIHLLFFRKPRW